jgi:hypothetical protein
MALFALIGFLISVQAESSLRDGVQSGLWPEDQLEALRRRIPAARYFNLASVLVGLAYLVFLAFALRFQTWRCDVPIWIATFPIQTIAGVSSILRNPQPVRPKEGLGLRNAQPIHSQEWGRTVR